MLDIRSGGARGQLARLFALGAAGDLSDAELLNRFAAGRGGAEAEAAFAELVDRHGPMVLGVCRRLAGDEHAAADAFQATFLVLARRAGSVRVDGTLARWLHGVSLRVARRARSDAARRRVAELDGLDPPDPRPPADPSGLAELRQAVDAEIARLPGHYRSAAVLCLLEGLRPEQAARRLRCPVKTVQGRLRRARERLRAGLLRRGLAPASAGLAAFEGVPSRAEVPPALAGAAASAARIGVGGWSAGACPAAAALAHWYLRNLAMTGAFRTAAALLAAGLTTLGAAAVTAGDRPGQRPADPPPAPAAEAPDRVATEPDPEPKAEPSLADRLAALRAEHREADRKLWEAVGQAEGRREQNATYWRMRPDPAAYARRALDLALEAPEEPAARDALTWIVALTQSDDDGPGAGLFAHATALLLHHHGDDPNAVRVGLNLDNIASPNRDALLAGFYASAKGREAKGLARLALAQYLRTKALMARGALKTEGRGTIRHVGVQNDDGTVSDRVRDKTDAEHAYDVQLRLCDPDRIDAEAERLCEEVIAEYDDVPVSGRPAASDGTEAARRPTIGEMARARLDDWRYLAIGKPAPEIEGVDLDGRPMKLSDHRGKVVLLTFWGAWCGPCVREIPGKRTLAERMQGRPFALLGVNTDPDPEAARAAVAEHGVTWPNWHDGEPGDGPIAGSYHIRSYPTAYVLDAEGTIRSRKASGEALESLVERLVAELESGPQAP